VRVGGQGAVMPATDLALLASRDRSDRFARGWRPLAALVPSTRSSRHLSVDDLTIWALSSGLPIGLADRSERIEERRDQ
jgi:hypothetical protein